jgi:hypothetical protein
MIKISKTITLKFIPEVFKIKSIKRVNQLESINIDNKKMIDYTSNEEFDELSLYFQDSTNLFTTWEMNKNHYENWSKKSFNDSVTFLPIDYNSPADSDSSKIIYSTM